jgi:deoxycytidylate deaminase
MHTMTPELVVPPSWAIERARESSLESPCVSKRGAAIWCPMDDAIGGYLVSTGFNDRVGCTGDAACKAECRNWAVHAEMRAILAARQFVRDDYELLHVKTVDGAIVPSGGPSCVLCSHMILAAKIAGVWLYHETGWRRYGAAEFHALSLEAA